MDKKDIIAPITYGEFSKAVSAMMSENQKLIEQIRKQLIIDKTKTIQVNRRGKSFQCYLYEKGTGKTKYISRKNPEVQKFAQSEYAGQLLRILEDNQEQLSMISEKIHPSNLINLFENLSYGRKQLVTPMFSSPDRYAEEWSAEPFEPLGFSSVEEGHKTDRGERVRSKSEVMIANELNRLNIPYKYEDPFHCGREVVYPDFTILNKETRRSVIWEHFGLIDIQDYRDSMVSKLRFYERAGLKQGLNLFFTFETAHNPLTKYDIDKVIERIVE